MSNPFEQALLAHRAEAWAVNAQFRQLGRRGLTLPHNCFDCLEAEGALLSKSLS